METNNTTTTQSLRNGAPVQFRVNESETVEISNNQEGDTLQAQRSSMLSTAMNHSQSDARLCSQHPLRILLVEDSMVNIKIALWFLRKLGYHADVAFNGTEAIDALKRRVYDLVFMDVEMPEMDGRVATVIIRNDFPSKQQPRIVAMTANASQAELDKYISMGMNGYITKPLKMEDLIRAIMSAHPLVPATVTTESVESSMARVA